MKKLLLVALAACGDPGVDARPSEIVEPTVIAVTVAPPEAGPGEPVVVAVTVAVTVAVPPEVVAVAVVGTAVAVAWE